MAEQGLPRSSCIIFSILMVLSCLTSAGSADEIIRNTEVGLGAGLDIESLNTHPSFVMARTLRESDEGPDLFLGLEGNFLMIDSEKTTYIASVVPFIKLRGRHLHDSRTLFGELGLGAGLSNHDEVNGRQLGGKFMFTIIGVFGLEVPTTSLGPLMLSTRFIHYSNGGLYPFNQSYNAQFIVISRMF